MQAHSLVWNWEELGRTKISFDVGFSGSTTQNSKASLLEKNGSIYTRKAGSAFLSGKLCFKVNKKNMAFERHNWETVYKRNNE